MRLANFSLVVLVGLLFGPGCGKRETTNSIEVPMSHALSDEDQKTIFESPIKTLKGDPGKVAEYRGKALLLVNVASRCGLTPQYNGLESLQKKYGQRGFEVLGFPCNQFGGQEPGSAEEIRHFCSTTYGVTFPMFEKIDVN